MRGTHKNKDLRELKRSGYARAKILQEIKNVHFGKKLVPPQVPQCAVS
jgi:hypothetical protein